MHIEHIEDWSSYKQRLEKYAKLRFEIRRSHIFRGLGDESYLLQPTLDRDRTWGSDRERQAVIHSLLEEFKEEAIRLQTSSSIPDGDALEFLARHYGLPSALLDWSKSPYVAAYFAYRDALRCNSESVAIWDISIARIPDEFPQDDIVTDPELLRFNPRAKQQRGIFVRVSSVQKPLEEQLGYSLRKFVLPSHEARNVLAELDEMMVNSTNLYYDLSGAAETAEFRVERLRSEAKS